MVHSSVNICQFANISMLTVRHTNAVSRVVLGDMTRERAQILLDTGKTKGYRDTVELFVCFCCNFWLHHMASVSSVAQSCLTLCDPMNHSTPGLPVHHQLPEFTQTHIHRASDAIQPSHPLLYPSPPAPNPSQHQGLFQ